MKFIKFNSDCEIYSHYVSSIHGDDIPEGSVPVSDDLFWRTINEKDGLWKIVAQTGTIEKHPLPGPGFAEIEALKLLLVQAYIDEAARAHRYDSIASAITYADEPAVPKFQAEGQAFRAWRSLVWAKCYAILADVNAGLREIPTDEELISELPALVLPE